MIAFEPNSEWAAGFPPQRNVCLKRMRNWSITMTRTSRTQGLAALPDAAFVCEHCGCTVSGNAPGTRHRNHCPRCLWSRHVDLGTGDRRCGCRGDMEPIAIATRKDGEWALVHRCTKCGYIRTNRIAGDDNELLLVSMAMRPMAKPPFPLDRIAAECSTGMENRS